MADVKVKIFFSYSHEDETLREELAKHLQPLERQGKIETWHDRKIEPGTNWRQELDAQLNTADIILLLVSSSFVSSEFCYCTELQQARKRHDAGEAQIIPIFLRPFDIEALEDTPLQTLQGLPEASKPITTWTDRDEAYTSVARSIRVLVNKVKQEKEVKQASQVNESPFSLMRTQVLDAHYVEREAAKKLLDRFEKALQQPFEPPLLFNICGIGGVGKTTLLKRLQEAQTNKVDFLEVCFAKTPEIETPLKLMRKLHQQAREFLGVDTRLDPFAQKEQQFSQTLFELSKCSVEGEESNSEEKKKITSWFERLIWLGSTNFTTTSRKQKSFKTSDFSFSALTATGDDVEDLKEWIQQRVRNHPATKDNYELQALMLEPVPKLTQAFAESLIQISQRREQPLVLVLDTYEKAQTYLDRWLWQYLILYPSLSSSPVRLVIVGRKSLQADESWRKLNQDKKLLYEVPLEKFSKSDTEEYLEKFGITNGGTIARVHRLTQGLPYYLDWARRQLEEGQEPDYSKGIKAIATLLFQGLDLQQQNILQLVACCRWFDLPMIRYLLESKSLDLQADVDHAENIFEWLKCSDFVEFSKGHYRLDDVARDVFRQTYSQADPNKFRKTNALLCDYFKQQADEVFSPQSLLPDPYEDEEWRHLIADFLYYGLFGKGKEGLQQYIEYFYAAAYLQEPDVFMAPFSFICSEINEENRNLLPSMTDKFFRNSGIVISVGWLFIGVPPGKYKIKMENEGKLLDNEIEANLKKIESSLNHFLELVDELQNGFGKSIGLVYKSLRCRSNKSAIEMLFLAEKITENLSRQCHPSLLHNLFTNLAWLLQNFNCHEDSINCCKKASNLRRDNALTFFIKGNSLYELSRYEEAIESYEIAIESSFDNDDITWSNQSAALARLNRYEEALLSSKKSIELNPENSSAWSNQSAILSRLNRHKEALLSSKKSIELNPENYSAWSNQGNIFLELNRYEEALQSYNELIELSPENSNSWRQKGIVLNELMRFKEALQSYKKAIELNPKDSNAYNVKALVLSILKDFENSVKVIDKAISLSPEEVIFRANRGIILARAGRFEEALADCNLAIEQDSSSECGYYALACYAAHQNNIEQVISSLQMAIDIAPHRCRSEAKNNPDFDGIRDNELFRALVYSDQTHERAD
jgi:tetratricopeptide (TPR) repeat protein